MFKSERRKIVALSKIIHYYKGKLHINATDHRAYYQIGLAHMLLGQQQLAIKHLKQALKYDKNNIEYQKNLGIAHYKAKEYHEAVKWFTEVLKQDQTDRYMIRYLASSYKALGDNEKAKQILDYLFETDNRDTFTILELANYYKERKEYRKCLFYYELLDTSKADKELNKMLGFMYEKTAQIEKAIEAYTHIIKHNPEEWKVWYTLGLLYLQKEDYSTARTCFMELVRNDVTNAYIYYDLAVVCVKMQDPRTLEFIQEAITQNKELIKRIQQEPAFSNIKRTKEYKELMNLIDKKSELLGKKVYIDGSNIAHYGNGKSPSLKNIIIIINRLEEVGFENIQVITGAGLWHYIDDKELYEIMKEEGVIIQAPARTDDDLLIIRTAMEKQGLILSNDSFNDYQFDIETSRYLKENQIRYSIIDDSIQLIMTKNKYLN